MFIFYAQEIKTGAELINSTAIKKIIIEFLSDKVFGVRNEMAQKLEEISETMGIQWTEQMLKQVIEQVSQGSNYHWRIASIRALTHISTATCVTRMFFNNKVLPVLESYAKDPVVNVRHNLAIYLKPSSQRDLLLSEIVFNYYYLYLSIIIYTLFINYLLIIC